MTTTFASMSSASVAAAAFVSAFALVFVPLAFLLETIMPFLIVSASISPP